MTNTRAIVGAPSKSPLTYGLFSVAEMRSEPTVNGRVDPHWKNGVTWQNVCPDLDSTYDQCIQRGALGIPVTGLGENPTKSATASRSIWGATPFTVYGEIDCSPPGFWEQAQDILSRTFDQAEQFEVEKVFFTGTVNTTPNFQFPHLAAAAGLVETEPGGATLQLVTGNVGPTGGGSLDVVEALGKLEQSLSACVKGIGVIHISAELLPHLAANHLLEERDGVFYTPNGHKLAVSAGYSGASPAGVIQVGVQWMYATGPVFIYRSQGKFVGTEIESLNRSVDLLKRIYERTYVIGYDCCLFAVPVSTGGVVTGAINSAV